MPKGEPMAVAGPILAIDIGGSKFVVGLVAQDGSVICSERYEWEGATDAGLDAELFYAQLRAGVDACRDAEPEAFATIAAAGVTVPGFCDPVTGEIIDTDFLKISSFPLCERLSRDYGIPFFADNDCKAAALAEQVFGAARGKSIFYVTVSTGVGGTHVLDDGICYGAFGHAGELGLVIADRHGYDSDQGLPGALEAHACGRGLVRNYLAAGGAEYVDGERVDGRVMGELAAAGDAAACAAFDVEGRLLARALAPICAAVDVEAVVIGGGMSLQFEHFGPSLEDEFRRLCPSQATIAPTDLGYLGAFMGAAALGLRGLAGGLPTVSEDADDDVIRVSLEGDDLPLSVKLSGRERAMRDGSAPSLGSFLLAENADDPGQSLISRFTDALAPYRKGGASLADALKLMSLAAATGDPIAQGTGRELGYCLGRALAALATVLDPARIEFAGALSRSWRLLGESCCQALIDETYYRGNLPFELRCV